MYLVRDNRRPSNSIPYMTRNKCMRNTRILLAPARDLTYPPVSDPLVRARPCSDSYFYHGGRNTGTRSPKRFCTGGWVKLDEDGGPSITLDENGGTAQVAAKVGDIVYMTNTVRDKRPSGFNNTMHVKKLLGMKFRKGTVKTLPKDGSSLKVENIELMPFQFVHVAVHDNGELARNWSHAVAITEAEAAVNAANNMLASQHVSARASSSDT